MKQLYKVKKTDGSIFKNKENENRINQSKWH